MVNFESKKLEDLLMFGIGILLIINLNVFFSKSTVRFDLTEEKRFTISDATVELLKSLNDVVYVDVYLEGQSGFVDILNPNQHFDYISFFGFFNKTFEVTVDDNAPEGVVVDFVNELTMGTFLMTKVYGEKISAIIEDFETGDFTKFNWQFEGNNPWEITYQYPYQGNYSAKSGSIGNSQSSEINLTYEVMNPDTIRFIKKVSSDIDDKLQFYIGNNLMGEWGGTSTGWGQQSFPVSSGNKTFRWVYVKNGGTTAGADCAWLDNIELPGPVCLTLWAGPDAEICESEVYTIEECYGTDYETIEWSTDGTGTFDDNTIMHPVYTPGPEDIENGSVVLTLTLWDDDNNMVSDDMTLSFMSTPDAAPTPEGPDYVDLFTTTTSIYSSEGIEGLDEYAWYLSPSDAGTIEGTTNKATVYWNSDYIGMAYVSVAALNECGEGEVSEEFEVTVDNTVGISETGDAFSMSVYPNPGNGNYQVMLNSRDESIISLKVFNLLGSKVFESSSRVNGIMHQTMDLQSLPNGIYILRVEGNNFSISRKIVKR